MRKIFLIVFTLFFVDNIFSQSTDDVYFDGTEIATVELKKNKTSEYINNYDSPDEFSYQTTFRRFHQTVRGFSYFSPYYVNNWYSNYYYHYSNWNYNYWSYNNWYHNRWNWYNSHNYWMFNNPNYYWYTPYNSWGWNNYWWMNNSNQNWWNSNQSSTNNTSYTTTRNFRTSDPGRTRSRQVPVTGYDRTQKPIYNSVNTFNTNSRTNYNTTSRVNNVPNSNYITPRSNNTNSFGSGSRGSTISTGRGSSSSSYSRGGR